VELTLLHRAYCHLCDEMQEALRPLAAAAGVAVHVVDVDADSDLEAVWGDLVPVLFLGPPARGNELCHYHLDAARVCAALRAGSA
jgi:thioredoxin reductase (NADPH)